MHVDRDVELAHAEAFDFVFGTYPQLKAPSSTAISPAAVTARPSWRSTARSARSSSTFPRRWSRQRSSKTGPSPRWSPRSPSRQPPPGAARARAYPIPGRQPFQEPETRLQPIPKFQPPAENETGLRRSRRTAGPGRAAGPAVVTRLPVWRRSRGRLAAIAAVAAAIITAAIVIPLAFGSGAGHSYPALCHCGGQGERCRGSYRAGNGPPGCVGELGHYLDRAAPQELRGCQVVRMLVHRLQTGTAAGSTGRVVPGLGQQEPDVHHDERR